MVTIKKSKKKKIFFIFRFSTPDSAIFVRFPQNGKLWVFRYREIKWVTTAWAIGRGIIQIFTAQKGQNFYTEVILKLSYFLEVKTYAY